MNNVEPTVDGIECSPCSKYKRCRSTLRSVIEGQLLSICLCGAGVSSQLLSTYGINTPSAQNFVNYFFLAFVYGIYLSCQVGDNGLLSVFRRRGWQYLLLAFIDVESNYLLVYAYQYTNLTSIQLLDCSVIPVVLVLSFLFLSVRYLTTHIVGVAICLVGITCIIWADILQGKGLPGGSNRLLGDILVLVGSCGYGIGNVCEEYLVKTHNRIEYLGMVGLFGSFIAGTQLAIFERDQLSQVVWSTRVIVMYLCFAISMFVFYSLVAFVMKNSSALMFNLSILSADFYTMIISVVLFHYNLHFLYIISFIIVITGSIIYSLRPTHQRDSDATRRTFVCCSSNDSITDDQHVDSAAEVVVVISDKMRTCPVHGQSIQIIDDK